MGISVVSDVIGRHGNVGGRFIHCERTAASGAAVGGLAGGWGEDGAHVAGVGSGAGVNAGDADVGEGSNAVRVGDGRADGIAVEGEGDALAADAHRVGGQGGGQGGGAAIGAA